MRMLLLDNMDSFTFNLVHLFASKSGCEVIVSPTDRLSIQDLNLHDYDCVVISPGPGHPAVPRDFRVCKDVILFGALPVLGVCLGHQGIAHYMGGSVGRARQPMHGRIENIHHNARELFDGIPSPFKAVRYHSLVVSHLPPDIEVTAWTKDHEVMSIAHLRRPLWGIQFHPESICTEFGQRIARNFQNLVLNWRNSTHGNANGRTSFAR